MFDFLTFSFQSLMFIVILMNKYGHGNLLGHPKGKNKVWVELKEQSCKKLDVQPYFNQS